MNYFKLCLVLTIILAVLCTNGVAFDCRRYIFAPKCRGISAKRSNINPFSQELFNNPEDRFQRPQELDNDSYEDFDLSEDSKSRLNYFDSDEPSSDLRFLQNLARVVKDPVLRSLMREKQWKMEKKI